MNRNPFVESLTAELRSGCRNSAPPRVGLELEQFLAGPDGSAAPFSCGVDVLHRMRPFYTEEQRSGGWLIRMGRSDCVVRLGPGGQLSCCVPPQPGLMQLRRGLERFSFELENALAAEGLTARNTTIVGLSSALGVGISQAAEALAQFPEAVTTIFGKSPVVVATLMAVLLNLVLPREEKSEK